MYFCVSKSEIFNSEISNNKFILIAKLNEARSRLLNFLKVSCPLKTFIGAKIVKLKTMYKNKICKIC